MKPVLFKKEEIKKLEHITPSINDIVIVGSNFYFTHPKRTNRLVLITHGQFYSNNRISNYWTWKEINNDGSLGIENSGYGNFYQPKYKYRLIQYIEFEKKQ